MYLECKKCLCSRTGDELGKPCQTPGCDGIVTEVPALSTLVDELPETMTCPRRSETFTSGRDAVGLDKWQKFKSNGNRVCSYCGSLHPDDMFALVKKSAEASEDDEQAVEIEPSDKGYKIYVHQPGVRNASEGGIKFYTQHLPRNADGSIAVTEQQQEEYGRAVAVSEKRFMRRFARILR